MQFDELKERLELCCYRLRQIPREKNIKAPFEDFFQKEACFLIKMLDIKEWLENEGEKSLESLRDINYSIYKELFEENYSVCYGNPDYCCHVMGDEYGRLFSLLYSELRGVIVYIYEGRIWDLVISLELFLECYVAFEDEEVSIRSLRLILENYFKDYCSEFIDHRIAEMVDPSLDFAAKIIMESDLSDIRYLYSFGEYISSDEIETAKFLNTMPQEEIDKMASTYTEGYRIGFITTGKDISKKKTVNIRYSLGFERMVKSAIKQFNEMGLKPVIYRAACHQVNKKSVRVGYFGADPNPQFSFDHRNDEALFLDEKFVTKKLSAMHEAFEKRKKLSNCHGGPACIEIFGEKPFVPEVKKNCFKLSSEQQELKIKYNTQAAQLTNRYIIGEERSFTIIAYPIPKIADGDNKLYSEIFKEIVRINTLDYRTYQSIQQKIIDALDKGERVHIKGRNGNETDLTVELNKLADPLTETNFENCVADVNIPVGEVFTSPVLKGTNGLLHVSEVYLNGLLYKNLRIWIENGMTTDYSCDNFEDSAEGKRYIEENILFRHQSLPIGEFAIGTNTTAYAMAKKYKIAEKLPILIAEKMGPHFAFGDTCYSWEEDIVTYNPDGKAIVARENECSMLRKTDPSRAYFNCHTDITIPYNELDYIYAEDKNGKEIYIIDNGRFVLEGCEELNKPIDEL